MEDCPAVSAERDILAYTPTYTVHPIGLRWTLSPSVTLSHCIHKPEHTKRKPSASSFRRSGTWTAAKVTLSLNVKPFGWKVIWSVTCHWTVPSLIEACHISSNEENPFLTHCWSVYKLKLTIAKCLGSPLHARTQPEPAKRAQEQSIDQHGCFIMMLNFSLIPGWHITMIMKQNANSWWSM